MATRPLIKESLLVLKLGGLTFKDSNICTPIIAACQIAVAVYFACELAFQLIFAWEDLNSTDGISAIGMLFQVCIKVSVVIAYSRVFARILSRIEQFWPGDRYGKRLEEEITITMKLAKKYVLIYFSIFSLSGSLYLVKPFYSTERILPFLTYHPADRNRSPQYELMFALQVGVLGHGSLAILGFDALFFSFIVHVICELKMIKRGFITMSTKTKSEKRSKDEISELVNHHNLVLECIKDLGKVYSLMLLVQFLCSLMCTCAGLLSLIGSGLPPDLQHFSKYTIFVSTILSQLFMYCLAGNYLMIETESVSKAVFESDWWIKTQPKVRRAYMMVIQRANKTERLTAGGMFTLDLESFTSVVRMSLSFFTLVQAVYSRTQRS